MPYSRRSKRSHEEGHWQKRAEDRQWMEALEPRVMLSSTELIDVSTSVERSGVGDAEFRFAAKSGETYLFLELEGLNGIHLLDDQGNEVIQYRDGSEPMPYTGRYYIQITGRGAGYGDYSLASRRVIDKEGGIDDAVPLTVGEPIDGTIDYYQDSDWFSFEAKA